MKTMIDTYFNDKEDILVSLLSRLVAIPSVKGESTPDAPFGPGPAKALQEAISIARSLGLSSSDLEGYVGTVDLNEQETSLHILAHLDVVEPGEGWSVTEPFVPLYKDGLLYGRGASDNKGPVVACLLAMKAIRDLKLPLSKNARLILGTDEESGFGDIDWYYQNHPYAPFTFAPDAEFPLTNIEKGHFKPTLFCRGESQPSDLPRVTALSGSEQINVVPSKARARVEGLDESAARSVSQTLEPVLGVTFHFSRMENSLQIQAAGKGTHASTPEQGNNALTALLTLLAQLPLAECFSTKALRSLHQLYPHGDHSGTAIGIAQEDTLSGPLTQALTMADLDDHGVTARVDCRVPLCATQENCAQVLVKAAEKVGFLLEGTQGPAHHTPADSPFVQTLLRCYEAHTGKPGHCLSTGGGTYVHHIPGGVAFGATMPGFDCGLHGPDERVSVPDLLTACKIFTQAIAELCR